MNVLTRDGLPMSLEVTAWDTADQTPPDLYISRAYRGGARQGRPSLAVMGRGISTKGGAGEHATHGDTGPRRIVPSRIKFRPSWLL
jgi:hypothetical protein